MYHVTKLQRLHQASKSSSLITILSNSLLLVIPICHLDRIVKLSWHFTSSHLISGGIQITLRLCWHVFFLWAAETAALSPANGRQGANYSHRSGDEILMVAMCIFPWAIMRSWIAWRCRSWSAWRSLVLMMHLTLRIGAVLNHFKIPCCSASFMYRYLKTTATRQSDGMGLWGSSQLIWAVMKL